MRIGIVGCGQLARMMALAGWDLGMSFSFLAEPDESTNCVDGLGKIVTRRTEDSALSIFRALGEPDVLTIEREHVDADLLRQIKAYCPVYPDPDTLYACQDRLLEKQMLDSLGIPVAPYSAANTTLQVADAVSQRGFPVVIKKRRQGYDGKGQWRVNDQAELRDFCSSVSAGDWLVESMVNFEYEVSFIAARAVSGELVLYPPTENHHERGILLSSLAPAEKLPPDLLHDGFEYLRLLLSELDYVGVLAVECFVTPTEILINELAPRVHNSGHWTLSGCATSQFENHLRAVAGMSLGATSSTGYQGMLNILGRYDRSAARRTLSERSTLVDYNKSDKPGRKLAHINVLSDSRDELLREMNRLQDSIYPEGRVNFVGGRHSAA